MALPQISKEAHDKIVTSASLEQILQQYNTNTGSKRLSAAIDASQIIEQYLIATKGDEGVARATHLRNTVGNENIENALVYDNFTKVAKEIHDAGQSAYKTEADKLAKDFAKEITHNVGTTENKLEAIQKLLQTPGFGAYVAKSVKQKDPQQIQNDLNKIYQKAGIRAGTNFQPEMLEYLARAQTEMDLRKKAGEYLIEEKTDDGKTTYKANVFKIKADIAKDYKLGRELYVAKAQEEGANAAAKKKAA